MSGNRLGMHMMLFTSQWDESSARTVFEQAQGLGYDFLEILIFDPDAVNVAMTNRLREEYGFPVEATICGSPMRHPMPASVWASRRSTATRATS